MSPDLNDIPRQRTVMGMIQCFDKTRVDDVSALLRGALLDSDDPAGEMLSMFVIALHFARFAFDEVDLLEGGDAATETAMDLATRTAAR
ncbi:hypothetical protein BH23ACT9_BH23ACT9_34140 [soil metagenome]